MLPFVPHPLLRSGHAQTLAAWLMRDEAAPETATLHHVDLGDGDRLVLHDDRPSVWAVGGPAAMLVHGLAGCHGSNYMRRIARKLKARGVRTIRMDMRGCGAGLHLARLPYHAGRSPDLEVAIARVAELCPASPISLLGFSLGGNVVLKLLGERGDDPPPQIARAAAVCPPIDLDLSARHLSRGFGRAYDAYFARMLRRHALAYRQRVPEVAGRADFARRPAGLWGFDDAFTAPVNGFAGAEDYYARSSSAPLVRRIGVPTLLLAARDDPLICAEQFAALELPPSVTLVLTDHGGHLGFLARRNGDPDRHWLDWRLLEWLGGDW